MWTNAGPPQGKPRRHRLPSAGVLVGFAGEGVGVELFGRQAGLLEQIAGTIALSDALDYAPRVLSGEVRGRLAIDVRG